MHTIPDLFRHAAQHYGDQPCIQIHAPGQTPALTHSVSFAELDLLLRQQAQALTQNGQLRRGDCIGILGDNSLAWLVLTFGAVYAGLQVLPISTRVLPEHLQHFVKSTSCKRLFAAPELATLAAGAGCPVSMLDTAVSLQPRDAADIERPFAAAADDCAIIMHTSGTTRLPKLVYLTHRNIVSNQQAVQRSIGRHWTGADSSLLFLPLFHGYTLLSQLLRNIGIGARTVLLEQREAVTPEVLVQAINQCGVSFICCVPWMLQLLHARVQTELQQGSSNTLQTLQQLNFIVTGGAPLDRAIGEFFTMAGVRLVTFFGLTEAAGFVLHSSFDGADWEQLQPMQDPGIRLIPLSQPAVDHELVLEGSSMIARCSDSADTQRYETSDLFRRGPQGWLHAGRKDLVYNGPQGEKINPRAVETALERLACVQRAFVSGEGLLCNYALVEAQPDAGDHPTVLTAIRTALKDNINPQLEAPARVYPNDVLLLPPDRPLPLTAKGTVDRARALHMLKELLALAAATPLSQIGAAGQGAAVTAQEAHGATASPQDRALAQPDELERVVLAAARQYLALPDNADLPLDSGLVQLGFDSLMTLSLRNLLQRQLGVEPPLELMLAFPSLRTLTTALQQQLKAGVPGTAQPPSTATSTSAAADAVPVNAAAATDSSTAAAPAAGASSADSTAAWANIPLEQVLFHTAHFIFPFPTFNVSMSLLAPRRLDRNEVEAALRLLEARHDVLRSVYNPEGQYRIDAQSFVDRALLDEHELQGHHDLARNNAAQILICGWLNGGFDLRTGPVYRYGLIHITDGSEQTRTALYLGLNHIAGDFKGFNALAGELMAILAAPAGAGPARSDHYAARVPQPSAPQLQACRQYWLQLLTVPPRLKEGFDPRAANRRYFRFDDVDLRQLAAVLRRHNISLFNGLYAVYALVMSRHLPGQSPADFTSATAITSRLDADTEQLMGCFIHSPIVKLCVDPTLPLLQVMESVQSATRQQFAAMMNDPVATLAAQVADPANLVPFLERNVFLYRSPEELVAPPTGWQSYRNEFFYDYCDVGMYFDCCANPQDGSMEGYVLLNLHYADATLIEPMLDDVRTILKKLDDKTLTKPVYSCLPALAPGTMSRDTLGLQ